ncbi:MAG: HNH endonuclease domain-containing protein [bacterium]
MVAGFLFLVFVCLDRRGEGIAFAMNRVVAFLIPYGIALYVLQPKHLPTVEWIFISAVAGVIVQGILMPRRRSRYIRATEKRKAIARYELTGKKYNPKKHDLDHDIPFSKGGSSTADNLRVRDRRVNRQKGNRSPWWDIFG